jgi:hypothetical protein
MIASKIFAVLAALIVAIVATDVLAVECEYISCACLEDSLSKGVLMDNIA